MSSPVFTPSHATWDRLARHEGEPCVTAILPLERSDLAGDALRLRFRHAVERANAELADRGVSPEERAQILEPLIARQERASSLPSAGATLLALLSPSIQEVRILGAKLAERVEVADRFVLSELLAVLDEPQSWYVLAVSDGGARLLHVQDGRPSEVQLPLSRPNRAAANAERVEPNPTGDHHGNRYSRSSTGGEPTVTQQGYGFEQTDQIERRTWYRAIEEALNECAIDGGPMVLVADTVHHGGFHEVSRRAQLLPQGVQHRPDGLSEQELRDLAAPLVQPLVQPDLELVRTRWHRALKDGRVETRVEAALEFARQGQVEAVMWVPDAEREAGEPRVSLALDELVRQTVLHGGTVLSLPRTALPAPGTEAAPCEVNAILRWSA